MKRYKTLLFFIFILSIIAIVFNLLRKSDYKDIIYFNSSKPIEDIPIDSNSVFLIKKYRETIFSEAETFGISPKAIIGIILTEGSLNNSPASYFEELYVKKYFLQKDVEYLESLVKSTIKKTTEKRLNGESQTKFEYRLKHGLIWTIGICQISIVKSYQIESEISMFKGRTQRNIKEVIKALLIPEENISYCAYELKKIRDTYLSLTGIDISDRHLELATLYNSGLVNEKASDSKITLNRFSSYIDLHGELITKLMNMTNNNG